MTGIEHHMKKKNLKIIVSGRNMYHLNVKQRPTVLPKSLNIQEKATAMKFQLTSPASVALPTSCVPSSIPFAQNHPIAQSPLAAQLTHTMLQTQPPILHPLSPALPAMNPTANVATSQIAATFNSTEATREASGLRALVLA